MNKLNELLNNENANPWTMFDQKDWDKKELKEMVRNASSEDLKKLIVKFDGHQVFGFMEDFICLGNADNMNEDEYFQFIDESGL